MLIAPVLKAAGVRNGELHIPHELAVPFESVKIGVIFFVALFLLGSHYIRDVTKLVLDVVNHFTGDGRRGEGLFPVRKRIADR